MWCCGPYGKEHGCRGTPGVGVSLAGTLAALQGQRGVSQNPACIDAADP